MLIDYVVGGLQAITIGLIVFGAVLCVAEVVGRERDPEDQQSTSRTDQRF